MKAFLLKVGFGLQPSMACRTVDGNIWSIKTTIKRYANYGRAFIRSCFGKRAQPESHQRNLSRGLKNKLYRYTLENPGKFTVSGAKTARSSKPHSWQAGFSRIISKWTSESFAAELRRNAAKRIMFQSGASIPLFSLVGFSLAKEPSLLSDTDKLQLACHQIKDAFHFVYNKTQETVWADEMTVSDLELGNVLAKGCNAVVYAAKLKETSFVKTEVEDISKSVIEMTSGNFGQYDLAVKMMFNYDAESNSMSIWRAMHRESVPAQFKCLPSLQFNRNSLTNIHLPTHPNIVDMQCAFADWVPELPGGMDLYPNALPARLNHDGFGRNMTLFLVMKRYHCTLKEYLQSYIPSAHTSLLLFSQLLEGLLHLQQHLISHRDLKADNILLDLTQGESAPYLVITDFGCCLADTLSGMRLPFPNEDTFRGGNIALMAPEVVTAQPGMFSVIDYSKSDLWTAGTLAYEIFGGKNPFYASTPFHLDNFSYKDEDLPAFPQIGRAHV